MAFFKGQEIYSLDSKGRVNIPVKMRKAMSPESQDTFTLLRGQEECIVAYPLDEWKKYEEKFSTLNQFVPENRYFLRTLLQWSEEVTLDAQQRIMLPKKLIEFAGLENRVMIIGMIDHIEFWNPEKFEEYMNRHETNFEDVSKKVMAT
jgi:MraZ protein